MLKFSFTVSRGTGPRAVLNDMMTAAVGAASQQLEAVMTTSKQLVPVDTGVLRSSGTVTQPRRTEEGVTIEIGYGGAAAPYATFVHEDLDAQHTIGQAKYLEEPLTAAIPDIVDAIAHAAEAAAKKHQNAE